MTKKELVQLIESVVKRQLNEDNTITDIDKIKGFTLKSGYHVTMTEKKHILQLLQNGMYAGGTKLKQYKIEKIDNDTINVKVASKYTASIGDVPKWHTNSVVLKINRKK